MADKAANDDVRDEANTGPAFPARLRVHALAKLLGVTSKRVIAQLASLGVEVSSAHSSVDGAVAEQVREAIAPPEPPAGPPAAQPEATPEPLPALAPSLFSAVADARDDARQQAPADAPLFVDVPLFLPPPSADEEQAPQRPARAPRRRAEKPPVATMAPGEPPAAPEESAAVEAEPTAADAVGSDAVGSDAEGSDAEGSAAPGGEAVEPPRQDGQRRPRKRSRSRSRAAAPTEAAESVDTPEAADSPEAAEVGDLAEDAEAESALAEEEGEGADDRGARRRRRGRRGRGRGRGDQADSTADEDEGEGDAESDTADTEPDAEAAPFDTAAAFDAAVAGAGEPDEEDEAADDEDAAEDEAAEGDGASRRRRRRRRRRSTGGEAGEAGEAGDDPPNTVVHEREPRAKVAAPPRDEVRGISGSTRLEAKRQRRRDGRDAGRRRPPILSESEFLARREAVTRLMVVREKATTLKPGSITQVGVLEDGILVEHFVTSASSGSIVGNIYLGRVQNVLPSMEAAFIDIGRGRNGVLYAGEVDWEAAGLGGSSRKIEQALRPGDQVLVQVSKDPVGHKGARLTTQISLAGRFLVYVPAGTSTGISRKLPDTERKRLKDILREIVPPEAGVIVRTASEGVSAEELEHDITRLQGLWATIEAASKQKQQGPKALYEEPDLLVKVVRDLFNEDFSELVIEGERVWSVVEGYIRTVAPDLLPRVRKHTSNLDVFTTYRIDEQLAKAMDRKVWLPSGGTLVIDRTEAMTVVDVNTGKFTGAGGNLEETVTRNNLEAAEEIVRQLRLRDIGGMIVIDFIDMVLESNRDLVLRRLTEALGRDRTRHQVSEVTSLGLVQLTRKRLGTGLVEAFSEPCEHCHGRGIIVHAEPVDVGAVEEEAPRSLPPSGRRNRRGRAGARPEQVEDEVVVEAAKPEPAHAPHHPPAHTPHPMFVAMAAHHSEEPPVPGTPDGVVEAEAAEPAVAEAVDVEVAAAEVAADEPLAEEPAVVEEPAAGEPVAGEPVEGLAGVVQRRRSRRASRPAAAPAAVPAPAVPAEPLAPAAVAEEFADAVTEVLVPTTQVPTLQAVAAALDVSAAQPVRRPRRAAVRRAGPPQAEPEVETAGSGSV